MAFDSFRDFINALDKAGELICRGLHKRAVTGLEKFSKRVQKKSV